MSRDDERRVVWLGGGRGPLGNISLTLNKQDGGRVFHEARVGCPHSSCVINSPIPEATG